MDKFKKLREKIEKREGEREEELREELRPFAKKYLHDKMLDLTREEVEKLTEEEWAQFFHPAEEMINKIIEEWIVDIKNKLEKMPKIKKVASLDELLKIIFSGKCLKDWQKWLEEKGHREVCDLLKHTQYMPCRDMPQDVEELIYEYWRIVAEKAREFREKEK